MATIGSESNGRKRILFVAGDGSRKTIRLGLASMKQAEKFKLRVEALVTAALTGGMDDDLARWLADLPDAMHDRIAAAGLAKPRSRTAVTLGAFLTEHFAPTSPMRPATPQPARHRIRHSTRRYRPVRTGKRPGRAARKSLFCRAIPKVTASYIITQWAVRDSNPLPFACKANALAK